MSFRIDDILKKDTKSFITPIVTTDLSSNENQTLSRVNDNNYSLENFSRDKNVDTSSNTRNSDKLINSYYSKGCDYLLSESSKAAFDYFCCGGSGSTASSNVDRSYYLHPYYQQNIYHPSYYYKNIPFSNVPLYYPHYSKRRSQVRFSPKQTDALENKFTSNKYLSPEDRRILADSLKLSDRQVKTWFQNRRAKWRRNNTSCASSKEYSKDLLKVKT